MLVEPGIRDLTIYQGSTFERIVRAYTREDSGLEEVDLTGYTAKMQVRQDWHSEDVLVELSVDNDRIGITAGNQVVLTLTDEETAELDGWDQPAVYDVLMTASTGERWVLLKGAIRFVPSVTRD